VTRSEAFPLTDPVDPAWTPLGQALQPLQTRRPPIPWPVLRRISRALRQSPAAQRPPDAATARQWARTALAAIGETPAPGALGLMTWALMDPLRLYTVTVSPPETAVPDPAPPWPARSLSPAQIQARQTLRAVWGARLRVMGDAPLPALALAELAATLRAGYGMVPWCPTGWQGFAPALLAEALWGVAPDALDTAAAAALRAVCQSAPPPTGSECFPKERR
jgi:hypothetical protein